MITFSTPVNKRSHTAVTSFSTFDGVYPSPTVISMCRFRNIIHDMILGSNVPSKDWFCTEWLDVCLKWPNCWYNMVCIYDHKMNAFIERQWAFLVANIVFCLVWEYRPYCFNLKYVDRVFTHFYCSRWMVLWTSELLLTELTLKKQMFNQVHNS